MNLPTAEIETFVQEVCASNGYELVQITIRNSGLIRILIERLDDDAVQHKDCILVSNRLRDQFATLFAERPISLEVSSPGIDRPLIKPADFRRFQGCQMQVRLKSKLADGRRNLKGEILQVITSESDSCQIIVKVTAVDKTAPSSEAEELTLDFNNIAKANLFTEMAKL